jgi:hypothetical protein
MMSNTAPKNGSSEVHNKSDTDTLANSREKLRLIILSVASRAHSHHWKMLDDTEDSMPSLVNISLDDVEHVCHSCGVCDKNNRKFIKRDLEAFMSTMDRNIVEIVHHNSSTHKSEQCLRLGGLKLKDSIMKPKLQHEKGSLVKFPNKTTHAVRLNPNERELLSKLVVEAKANASAGNPQETSKPKSKEAVVADDPFSSLLRDLTKMLEPAEITKREERLMRKMINNCIQRTLMELFAEIRDTKLTDVHEHATETNEPAVGPCCSKMVA